ncbi:MAG: hypothetical protein PHO02_02400 [Candidatus Nanoarchaeia archaeon]|nr:hypothetical protein [Candidatus Nanoarchaeia archaeon]
MKYCWILIIAACLLLSGCAEHEWDKYSGGHDFNSFLEEKNVSADDFAKQIDSAIKKAATNTERAELVFLLSRVTNDRELASFAMDFFHKAAEDSENKEEKALLYETVASIEDTRYNHLRSAETWLVARDNKRALINLQRAAGIKSAWKFDIQGIANTASFTHAFTSITLGSTEIELGKDDLLAAQAHKITRDFTIPNLPSPYSESLLGTPEGSSVDMIKAEGIKQIIAAGALAKEMDGKWYASNEEDVFMFEVPVSVIEQPTTRFLSSDIAVIADTNGMAAIARNAVEQNATAVTAGCDSSGDVKAAKYLAEKGIKVICSSGQMLPLLIGANLNIVSGDFRADGEKIIFGGNEVRIGRYEPLVVMDYAGKADSLLGYSTPARYFLELEKRGAKMNYFIIEIDEKGQIDKVLKKAMEKKAPIVAVRVYDEEDYNELKKWLEEKSDRKAILFDSETSEFGCKIAREFRSQIFFMDINPVIR